MTVNDMENRIAELTAWADHCARWREQLVHDLVALHESSPPSRGRRGWHVKGVIYATELAIRTIDQGTGVLKDTGYDLTNLPLTKLMRESGFVPIGADPDRNYSGTMPWLGSAKEVAEQLTYLTARRDAAKAQLAEATLTDAERAERDADRAAYRDVLNTMRLKNSDDGTYLVAFDRDGRELDPSELTPTQRTALERANRQHG